MVKAVLLWQHLRGNVESTQTWLDFGQRGAWRHACSCSGITGKSSLGESCYIHTLLWGNTSAVSTCGHLWEGVPSSAIRHRLSMTAQVSQCYPHCFMLPLWASHKQSTFIVHAHTHTQSMPHMQLGRYAQKMLKTTKFQEQIPVLCWKLPITCLFSLYSDPFLHYGSDC